MQRSLNRLERKTIIERMENLSNELDDKIASSQVTKRTLLNAFFDMRKIINQQAAYVEVLKLALFKENANHIVFSKQDEDELLQLRKGVFHA